MTLLLSHSTDEQTLHKQISEDILSLDRERVCESERVCVCVCECMREREFIQLCTFKAATIGEKQQCNKINIGKLNPVHPGCQLANS